MKYVLDNFQDWGQVLDGLKKIEKKGDLHRHQHDLIRMLKYKGNWRLREAALESIPQIENPVPELVCEVLNVILDDNVYCEARVMACRTLNQLIENGKNSSCGCRLFGELSIADNLKTLTVVPQPPMLMSAVSGCLSRLADSAEKEQVMAARTSI
jgi:hypothetical protein